MRNCLSEINLKKEPKFPFKKRPESGFSLFNINYNKKVNENNNNKINKKNENKIKNRSLKDLRESWKRKFQINFAHNERKFLKAKISPEVIRSKLLIKEMIQPDILKLKNPKWNQSVILDKRIDYDSIYDLSIFDKRIINNSFSDNERTSFRKFTRKKFIKALIEENEKKKKKKQKKKKKEKKQKKIQKIEKNEKTEKNGKKENNEITEKKKKKLNLIHYNTIETKKTNFRNVKKITFEEIKLDEPINSKKIIYNLKEDLNPKNESQIDNIKNRNFLQRRSRIRPETTLNSEMVQRILIKHANQLLNSSRSLSDISFKKTGFKNKMLKTKTKLNIPLPLVYKFSNKRLLNKNSLNPNLNRIHFSIDDSSSNQSLNNNKNDNSIINENNSNKNNIISDKKNSFSSSKKSELNLNKNTNIISNYNNKNFKPFTDELLVERILTIESIKNEINPYHKNINILLPLVQMSKTIEIEENKLMEENKKKFKISEKLGKKKKEKFISQLDAFKLAYKKIYRNCVSEIKKQEKKIEKNYYEGFKHPGIYVYIFL